MLKIYCFQRVAIAKCVDDRKKNCYTGITLGRGIKVHIAISLIMLSLVGFGSHGYAESGNELDDLLKQADQMIEQKQIAEPDRKSPRPSKRRAAAQAKKREKKSPSTSSRNFRPSQSKTDRSEIEYKSDPKLAALLKVDAEQTQAIYAQPASLRWLAGVSFYPSPSYEFKKDDDRYLASDNQNLVGIDVQVYPFFPKSQGGFFLEPTVRLTVFSQDVEVQREGLMNEQKSYQHNILVTDIGYGLHEVPEGFENIHMTANLYVSAVGMMQDGTRDEENVFDGFAAGAVDVRFHTPITRSKEYWLSLGATQRGFALGRDVHALEGFTFSFALGSTPMHQVTTQ